VGSNTDSVLLQPAQQAGGVKVLEEENKLGFIPFAMKRWGDSMSASEGERVMPLLQSIYSSGQWDMLNVFESLDASLAIKRAAKPEYAGEYPSGQDPEIDNTDPSGNLKLPPGTKNWQCRRTRRRTISGKRPSRRSCKHWSFHPAQHIRRSISFYRRQPPPSRLTRCWQRAR
jgi:hypothetical protein